VILLTLGLGLALSRPLPAESDPTPLTMPHLAGASPSAAFSTVSANSGEADPGDALTDAEGRLRQAMAAGAGNESGTAATLELARLEYADGRAAEALADLEAADAWPREGVQQPEWLYWRGQSRLALKQWTPAEHDLGQLAALWPNDPHAGAARLGAADCEAALGEDASAAVSYNSLAVDGGPFAAQALYGLGTLYQGQGRLAEARQAYQRLRTGYPASFEAQAVPARLAEIEVLAPLQARSQARAGGRRGRWSVQVGAYSKLRWAEALARPLRRHHFRVKVLKKNVDGRLLYLVQVGPYGSRPAAAAAAQILQSREKLPFNLVEE
jgi:tetratricopeptide (TPR) repeat protein